MNFTKFLLEQATAPTPGNVDSSFKVGDVTFDNVNGLGATPSSQNVMYAGAVAWIKPSIFRKLATPAERSDTAKELAAKIKEGSSIACPFLIIDIIEEPDSPEIVKVISHEGRARSEAFQMINGDVYMPVQLHQWGCELDIYLPNFSNG